MSVLAMSVPLIFVMLVMLIAEATVSLSAVTVALTYCSAVVKAILKGADSNTNTGLTAFLNKPP